MAKRTCNGCNESVEIEEGGQYVCANCGYDRDKARARLRQEDALSLIRGEVSAAIVGVEFDFEQRLFSVSGKVALAITVACLYILPKFPNFKQMAAKG